ncbi:hypothetical protein MAPG_05479 [Magnaporthiopsis poae ATCC 64411]|uniref:Uncharacterized protein n=1 Tax=Magnaporthiopsis poae (strain ATCC 64411 / 73-15) TaxID=644358 RepID=A0A0C4DZH8_MAGP6|nr:hypothetical protein MAPG_05479 [Magnaporthiopsis poae ATCC 64411]
MNYCTTRAIQNETVRCAQSSLSARPNGKDLAGSLDVRFFAQTFPTLFPTGSGGPRQAEERVEEEGTKGGTNAATARGLIASRNMGMEVWARMVLQRHGGHFATHHVFALRGQHARSAAVVRNERAALQAPRMRKRFRRRTYHPFLRGFPQFRPV